MVDKGHLDTNMLIDGAGVQSPTKVQGGTFGAKYPLLHKCRSKLKQFDLFAFTPAPRFENEKQVSLRGLLGSALALAVLFAYMGVATDRFISATPSISQVQQPPDKDPIDFVPTAMVFRVNDAALVPSIVFYNESFFQFRSSVTAVSEQDRFPRVVTHIPVQPCDISSWAGWLGANAQCPQGPLQVQGRYQSNNYTFSRFDVVACDPSNPYNASDGSGPVTCAPQAEISRVLAGGRFNLLQQFDSKMPGSTPSWEAHMYLVDMSKWSLYEQSYAIRTINVNAEYLRTWTDQSYNSMELDRKSVV